MDENTSEAPRKVRIRNVTRSSLSFQVPGESIRLGPGQSVEVHKAYLGTTELKTLCLQGAVIEVELRPIAKAAADEGDTEPSSEHVRRSGSRKR